MTSTYRKLYRFYLYGTDDEFLEEKLDIQINLSSFIKEILTQYYKGELIKDETPDLMQRKLVAEVRIKEATAALKEWELLHLETFGNNPSHAAEKAARSTFFSFIDEKNQVFYCPKCDEAFRWKFRGDLLDKKMLFLDHYLQVHGANLPADKEKELQAL